MSRMVCECHGFIYDSDFHDVCPMCEAEPVEDTETEAVVGSQVFTASK